MALKLMVGKLAYSLLLPREFLLGKVQKNALANSEDICFCDNVIFSLVHRCNKGIGFVTSCGKSSASWHIRGKS